MSLTLSGNEITQAQRTAALLWGINQQGGSTDGLGLYENRLINGSAEVDAATGISNWAGTGIVISRDVTVHQFGAASFKCVTDGTTATGPYWHAGQAASATRVAILPSTSYAFSVWAKGNVGGESLNIVISFYDAANNNTSSHMQAVILTAAMAKYTFTFASDANSAYGIGGFRQPAAGVPITFWCDGAMFEIGSTAHDYVDKFGIAPAQGFGIWEGGVNRFRRGQCDNIGAGGAADSVWAGNQSGMVGSVDATTPAPFSPNSIKYVCDGTVQQLVWARTSTGQAAAAGVIGVGSVYFKGTAGRAYQARMVWTNTDASNTVGASLSFTGTGGYQAVGGPASAVGQVPSLAIAAGKVGDALGIEVGPNGASAETYFVAHAMLQTGVQVVSPYVATSGAATAFRNGARVQAPSKLFSASQGAFATFITMGADDVTLAGLSFNPRLMAWENDGNNRLLLVYDRTNKQFVCESQVGGGTFAIVGTAVVSPFATNAGFLVACKWDATNLYISVNGSIFTSVSSVGKFPALVSALFDIGNENAFTQLDGKSGWVLCSSTLTNADVATLSALGSTAPTFSTLPIASRITMIWPGVASDASDEKEFYYGDDVGVGANTATPTGRVSGFDTATGSAAASLKVKLPIASETPHSVDAVDIGFSWFTGHESGSGSDGSVKTEPVQYPPSLSGGIAQRGDGRAARPENGTAEEKPGR